MVDVSWRFIDEATTYDIVVAVGMAFVVGLVAGYLIKWATS